jgi:DNA-binding transcriptional ArsR family regulator
MALEQFDDRAGIVSKELLNLGGALFNPQRVAILLDLFQASGVEFSQLKHDLDMSDGALGTHLKVLVGEELVETSKEVVGTREKTGYLITAKGIQAIENLLKIFKEVGVAINYE